MESLARRFATLTLAGRADRDFRRLVSSAGQPHAATMIAFLLWLLLLVVCWPLALLALVLYPLVWLLLLPFRLVGIAFEGVFAFLHSVLMLPARVLRGPR
jgi:hypothetical protein